MRYWKRSNELRTHIEEHLKSLQEYSCIHPMCQEQFQDEMGLRYHLADIHGLQKAIWDRSKSPRTVFGESPESQLDKHFKRNGTKRKFNQTDDEHCKPKRLSKKARESNASPNKTGQRQDLRVVQWKPPNPATCFSDSKGDNVHIIQDLDFADTEHASKYLRSSPADDVHTHTLRRGSLSVSHPVLKCRWMV